MEIPQRAAFIVGAPRCGTSSLARLFKQHPEVSFSSVKEPHFFSRFDLAELDERELTELVGRAYVDRFFGARDEQKMLMEASPTYFYAAERMSTILRLWPDAKFIIALRDPLAMIPSLHSRLLMTCDEDVSDLKRAWDLIPERRNGREVPRSCIDARFLRYDEAARFATHLNNFFTVVGEYRCLDLLLDDFSSDPVGSYEEICSFLNLQPWPHTEFKVDRKNHRFRLKWLQRLLNRPPKPVLTWLASDQFLQREGIAREQNRFFKTLASMRKRLLRWNEYPAARGPLDDELRLKIARHYRQEVEELSKLIRRDLGHWLRV